MLLVFVDNGLGQATANTLDYELMTLTPLPWPAVPGDNIQAHTLGSKTLVFSPGPPIQGTFTGIYENGEAPVPVLNDIPLLPSCISPITGTCWIVASVSGPNTTFYQVNPDGTTFDLGTFFIVATCFSWLRNTSVQILVQTLSGEFVILHYAAGSSPQLTSAPDRKPGANAGGTCLADTGAASLKDDAFIKYTADGDIAILKLYKDDSIIQERKVPVWDTVGGNQTYPVGSPVIDNYGNFYVRSQNQIINYDDRGNPIAHRAVTGLKGLGSGVFTGWGNGLVINKSEIDFGTVDAVLNYRTEEFVVSAVDHPVYGLVLVFPVRCVGTLDFGTSWHRVLEFPDMEPGEYMTVKVKVFPPEGPSPAGYVIGVSGGTVPDKLLPVKFNAVIPESYGIQIKAVHPGTQAFTEKILTVRRTDLPDNPEAPMQDAKIKLKANFL